MSVRVWTIQFAALAVAAAGASAAVWVCRAHFMPADAYAPFDYCVVALALSLAG